MNVTWENIITLLDNLYKWNQQDIADKLGVHRSTISRLKHGKQTRLNKTHEEIYTSLFAEKGSANPTKALNEMKRGLEEMGLDAVIDKLGDSDYESFSIGLIKLANLKNKAPKNNSTASATLSIQQGDTKKPTHSPPREPLYQYFDSAVEDFPIVKFLASDPVDSLSDYLIRDAVTFWGHINAEMKQRDAADRNTETGRGIITFIDALKDYLGFLMANSERPDAFPDDFHLIGGDSEVTDKANSCRENLKNLFNEARATAKAEREKIGRERANTTHAGEYLPPSTLKGNQEKFKAT